MFCVSLYTEKDNESKRRTALLFQSNIFICKLKLDWKTEQWAPHLIDFYFMN